MLQRGGQPKRDSPPKKSFIYKKEPKEPTFLFWPARTNIEGGGSGRGTNIYACWRLRVRIPLCTCDFFCWLFATLGRKSQRAQKGELCAAALAEVAELRLGVGRGSLIFSDFFDAACFAVYNARRLLGSKTWISATLHRQGPRMVSEARNACFGITGARNRPIPTLLPSETCTQTPLGRPKMLLRRDPDFADAPEQWWRNANHIGRPSRRQLIVF